MNKIKIKNDIFNLDCMMRVTVAATHIEFSTGNTSIIQYEPGHALSQTEFDTLSACLLNPTNHPYTVVVE